MRPFARTPGVAAIVAFALTATPLCLRGAEDQGPAATGAFRVPAGQRQLFLDEYGIRTTDNLLRTMHRPQKRGAVIRSPLSSQSIQTRTAPVWDPDARSYKLWVLGIDQTFWQSPDGLHWTPGPQPNQGIVMAVYDPLDPNPARRFKAPLLDRGFAVSPDGIQWTALEIPGIPSSDEGNFSYDPSHGLFVHTVKRGGPHGRSVALATSADFETWTDLGLVFQADDLDQELGKGHIAARMACQSAG